MAKTGFARRQIRFLGGEIAYSGEVTENLEKIVRAAKQALTEVAVVKYPDAVA